MNATTSTTNANRIADQLESLIGSGEDHAVFSKRDGSLIATVRGGSPKYSASSPVLSIAIPRESLGNRASLIACLTSTF